MRSSSPGSRTSSTSSPGSITVSALGTKPRPLRSTEMISEPSGSSTSETLRQAAGRHLVLDEAQDQVGRADRGLNAQELEVLAVSRVVDARDDPRAEVFLLGDLADEEVVLVIAGHRDGQVGAVDARALEHPQLGRVAVLDGVLELLLDGQIARALALDHRHL